MVQRGQAIEACRFTRARRNVAISSIVSKARIIFKGPVRVMSLGQVIIRRIDSFRLTRSP